MKRRMFAVTILSAVSVVSLTGCTINVSDDTMTKVADAAVSVLDDADIKVNDQKVNLSLDSNSNITVAQTTAAAALQSISTTAVTPAPAETIAPATQPAAATQTTAAPAAAQTVLSEAQMKEISKKLIQEYASLSDGIIGGSVQVDENDSYQTTNTNPYFHVTDPKYQSIADLKEVTAKTATGSELSRMNYCICEEQPPLYMELEGKLYVLSVVRGNTYSDTWRWDELQFTKVTANSFTVTGKYVHYGEMTFTQSFDIVETESGFRINSVSMTLHD